MMHDSGFDETSKLNFEEFERFMETVVEDMGPDLDIPMEEEKK